MVSIDTVFWAVVYSSFLSLAANYKSGSEVQIWQWSTNLEYILYNEVTMNKLGLHWENDAAGV